MIRKFKRNSLRKKYGNKGLRSAWRAFQKRKYGENYYIICKSKGEK